MKLMPKVKSKDWEKRIRDFIKKIDYGGNWTPLGLKQHGDTLISIIRSQLALSYSQGQKDAREEIRKWTKGQKWKNKDAEEFWHSMDTTNPFTDFRICHNDALDLIINHLEGK